MKKNVILALFFTANVWAEEVSLQEIEIPNSSLSVRIPHNWNYSKPYIGDGKYSSVQVYLPKEDHGGYPGYPEFEFEYSDDRSENVEISSALKKMAKSTMLGEKQSYVFTETVEVSYLLSDMSHSNANLKVTYYFTQVGSGYLICSLRTLESQEGQHKKYSANLESFCRQAVTSGPAG
ncbi:hypothetical protein [Microbulbifer magnicolonia]|uniref:hypothetical protein n=1 Tax=Microbulbifer magnicolonia TaxID=3109744 RepID=UPI002B41195A|nr:hypothetical protein [Microbulbifer sp. GG15]